MLPIKFTNDGIFCGWTKNYKGNYCGYDSPDLIKDKYWFKNCPIQNFNYNFNSWGFRADDFSQYIGKPVILCLGDSATLNLAGPIEHSWPSLLQEKFDIPCLNFGSQGAGNDAMRLIYDSACKFFDVKYTFVVYSFFDRRFVNLIKFTSDPHEFHVNINYFKENQIPNAFQQFLPYWCNTAEEQEFINSLVLPYVTEEDMHWNNSIDRIYVNPKDYEEVSEKNWPSFDNFLLGHDIDDLKYLKAGYRCLSRDAVHFSLYVNKKIADNLYNQFLNKEKT